MDPRDSGTGRILREALRAREEEAEEDASRVVSILEVIQRLKQQISEKDRIISARADAILRARDYLHRVLAALADPVLVIDPRGRVEFANQATLELLDETAEDVVGRAACDLWAEPGQRELFQGQNLVDLFRQETTQRADLLIKTRSGNAIPVAWTATVLHDEGGPAGLVGIARDARVQRRLEEDKLRTVQALAASVAHEIRNPLGAIRNSIGLLHADLDLSGDDKDLMEIVIEETERISSIVTQFMTFAKPPRPTFGESDIPHLLQEVVTLAEQDSRAEGKTFLVHADSNLPPLTVDEDQIKQVVWNLVINALDAAREVIALRVRTLGHSVEVKIADDGPGMPPEIMARATEPFRTTKAQGTGLGLAICKRIVEAHGGTLRLESVPEAGTAVSFVLPATPPLAEEA